MAAQLEDLLALLGDNNTGDISAADLRSVVISLFQRNLEDINTAITAFLVQHPEIVQQAATAAAQRALTDQNVVLTSNPRLPANDLTQEWVVQDTNRKAAIHVQRTGLVKIPRLFSKQRSLGTVVETNNREYEQTVKDSQGKVATKVRRDGKFYIASPVFGRKIRMDEIDGTVAGRTIEKVILEIGVGQSNSEGRGRPIGARLDYNRPIGRMKMITWDKNAQPGQSFSTNPLITGIAEATVPLSSQQNVTGLSIHTVIGQEFVRNSDERVEVVVWNAAAGGSGLISAPSQGSWKIDYNGSNPRLFNIFITRLPQVIQAIQLRYPGAIIEPWFFWHQGEADSSPSADYLLEYTRLIQACRDYFGTQQIPWVGGGMVPEWWSSAKTETRKALILAQSSLEYVGYADGIPNGGGSQDAFDDEVHYNAAAVARLGKAMYWAGQRAATASSNQIPNKPLEVSATLVNGTLDVRWSDPMTRFTDFLVEYSLDDGSTWTSIPRTIAPETRQTLSGLSTSARVMVRVTSINGSLVARPTIPVYALRG